MAYYLGVDVGSSKTHALIADSAGRCLGFGKAGAGNYQGVGYDGLTRTLLAAVGAASQMAGVGMAQIAGAGFGVAGYDWPSDRPAHMQSVAALGLSCPLEIVNDAVNGLLAGTTHGVGINITAGTSNNCRGRNRLGREGRIVGNGWAFGEHGGGAEIVQKALQQVNYAWIERIAPTALTGIFLQATGATSEIDLMEGLSFDRYHLGAHIAVQVFAAAQAGDQAALDVIRWAGEELAWLVVSVARQLEMTQDAVEVVESGSVFEGGVLIREPFRRLVTAHIPRAQFIHLDAPPVVGAVLLGMEQAGFDGYAHRETFIRSAKDMVRA